mgnify:FL=1
MRLKKLELQGFKSFADKTEIIVLDGVTTIVGPNGSGKSNISDAVRWVLGEQSVKNLRGQKMEDVIFAGTQARKKVGFAEVSLYLDNSDESLPVEFKEVVVTRRVYRSGESNYLLNGAECRLKDIQELFMDTGVGKDGYSIISQGKIDEILSTKSEERRHIFEEASGIVKYKTRKDEAVKKLANTDSTLARVNDVIAEIENNLEPLEKKCEVAKKYLELKDKLKVLDVRIFIQSLNQNAEALCKIDDVIETFTNDISKEEAISAELEKSKMNLKERLADVTLKIEETQSKFYETESENQKLSSKIEISRASIENANENIERLNVEIKEDFEKINLLKEDIEKRLKKKESLEENKKKFENELSLKQEELENVMSTLDERAEQITAIKDEIDLKREEAYELKMNSSSIEATIEANNSQIEEKEKILDKNITANDSVTTTKEELTSNLNSKNTLLNEILEKENKYNEDKKILDEKYNEMLSNERKLNQEVMTLKSKYNYLTNLENENEGYYKSVKESLSYAKKNNMQKVYGTVASLISTEEKYEYAVEIALGGYMQNVVVNDEQTAKKIISYLKENSLGRVTFLPINTIKKVDNGIKDKARKLDGYIGMASEIVKYDSKFKDVILLSLGSTIVVDTVDNAILMSKKLKNMARIVTLTGELFSATGSITGGKNSHSSAGLLGRKEKIENLKEIISNKEKEYSSLNNGVRELNIQIEEAKKENNKIVEEKSSCQIEIATLKEKLLNIEREERKVLLAKENAKLAIDSLKEQNETLRENIEENNKKVEELEEKINENQEIVDEYSRFNKEKSEMVSNLHEDIANLKVSISSFDESSGSIDEMKDKLSQDIQNFEDGIERKKSSISNLEASKKDAEEEIKALTESIKEKQNFKLDFANILNSLKDTKKEVEQKQETLEVKVLEGLRKIDKLKDERAKVQARKLKFDIEIENLKNKMWDDYEITISVAKEMIESLPVDDSDEKTIVKNAEKIRKEIKDLGEVSVGAIEEYKSTKERYDFISNQKADLEETKKKLENLINNMTSIMKQQFEKQFKLINENFNETFKELFGGGKAELKLEDESNVLSSGIEIEVQPPGKKLQSMMLLSGGERALTATALLFAILKLKAPPFCILDEIEAALDDVNVHRFAEYIKKYSKNTQFIVITHRKGTMEVASSTYGITMQEYGISKVVSMKMK